MAGNSQRLCSIGLAVCLAAAGWYFAFVRENITPEQAMLTQRIKDLSSLRHALAGYKAKYGAYPKSTGWDGILTNHGAAKTDWIAGLVPEFVARLPRDPRKDANPDHQYLYNSNGLDYKLIAHHPDGCELAKGARPEMIDPQRGCQAFGYWTAGAANW